MTMQPAMIHDVIVVGEESIENEVLLSLEHIQDVICSTWKFAPVLGWGRTMRDLSVLFDILARAVDADHPVLVDLGFLIDLTLMHIKHPHVMPAEPDVHYEEVSA